ncbi:MAG: hypothetical protein HZA93_26115 [Verrucomicrobia bacterium]|nr:hypothetical protein [Verrucomicrobiota bacterium]
MNVRRDDEEADEHSTALGAMDCAAGEVLRKRASYENEGPRDSALLRWLKFAAILIVLPVIFGVGLAVEEYFRVEDDEAPLVMQSDAWLMVRFKIGAAVGTAVGLAYVVRCILKKEDP